jgi:hypothetical protein
MAHGVDIAVAIGTTVTKIADRLSVASVLVIVCTNFYFLYECFVKLGTTKEKRLMINIMAMRQTYEHQEIYDVRWINGESNPADAMTKVSPNQALEQFITTNSITIKLQGWVKRNRMKDTI